MISALVLSSFLFTVTETEPLDILEEPASTICTPSGCPLGGHGGHKDCHFPIMMLVSSMTFPFTSVIVKDSSLPLDINAG